jgi:hypothetical protein
LFYHFQLQEKMVTKEKPTIRLKIMTKIQKVVRMIKMEKKIQRTMKMMMKRLIRNIVML